VFETCDDIVEVGCKAWNALTATVTSIATRQWAKPVTV